ncbi:MAG: dihydropteroate synthase [Verrucomicrobiota bacterium]|jgi:dihydropteroate synthase
MGGRTWKIAGREVDLSRRGMIMGVLNVTPDSFSDGGEYFSVEKAVAHGCRLVADGAQIIDIGGESTRPGAAAVSIEEELRRVIPVIEQLHARLNVFLSIDTSKSEVAEAALDAGAVIVNDVTGGRGDERMCTQVAKRSAAFVVMHMQGDPRTMQEAPSYVDVVAEVADFFRQHYVRAVNCGIDPMAIAFDPGIGFGKTLAHNLQLLGHLEHLRIEDRPVVIGVSRKAFLTKLTGVSDLPSRANATAALTAFLWGRGAQVFRVHDVKESGVALRLAESILEC